MSSTPGNDGSRTPFWGDNIFIRFGEMIDDLVDRLMERFGGEKQMSAPAIRPSLNTSSARQTISGLVQRGLDHLDRKRRQAQIRHTMTSASTAAALTRRAIRSVPRRERKTLFGAYRPVLRDAHRRVHALYNQIVLEEHQLTRHSTRDLERELATLRANDPTSPLIPMRQALLEGLEGQQKRYDSMVDQLTLVATALELNHLRVVEIAGMVNTHTSLTSLDDRLLAASEQLGFLVETLRELQA